MKKPNIFKPNITNVINNNKKTYYSYLEADLRDGSVRSKSSYEQEETPTDTLNHLFNSGSYIFNKKVAIITNNKTYDTKIAGKIGNRIITIDGDDILLGDIKKIIQK